MDVDEDEEDVESTERKLPKKWSCKACTLVNKIAASKCAACGSKRPAAIQRMLSSKRLSASIMPAVKDEHKAASSAVASSSAVSAKAKATAAPAALAWRCTKTTWKDIKKAPDRWEIEIRSQWTPLVDNAAALCKKLAGRRFLLVCDQMASKLDANSYQTNMRGEWRSVRVRLR